MLLDQFPRNAFRGTPRMYATDALARAGRGRRDRGRPRPRRSSRSCSSSSTCRSAIPRTWPTRSARSRSPGASGSPTCRTPSDTATSSGASAASRIAIRSSGAPCRRRSSDFSTKAATPGELLAAVMHRKKGAAAHAAALYFAPIFPYFRLNRRGKESPSYLTMSPTSAVFTFPFSHAYAPLRGPLRPSCSLGRAILRQAPRAIASTAPAAALAGRWLLCRASAHRMGSEKPLPPVP